MRLLEIRVGLPLPNQHFQELRPGWPDKENDSSYEKRIVDVVECSFDGLASNAPGYPSHIADSANRAALFYHLDSYSHLTEKFPDSKSTLARGGFGENFIVDHPQLSPSSVCIGDVFEIGTAQFTITGPRFPCPKVNSWHATDKLQKYSLQHGLSGYFAKVSQPGKVSTNDPIKLVLRKNPGFTIKRISEGLWGPDDLLEDSVAFYTALSNMSDLLGKGFKDVAKSRLETRMKAINDLNSSVVASSKTGLFTSLLSSANVLFCVNRVAISVLCCVALTFSLRRMK